MDPRPKKDYLNPRTRTMRDRLTNRLLSDRGSDARHVANRTGVIPPRSGNCSRSKCWAGATFSTHMRVLQKSSPWANGLRRTSCPTITEHSWTQDCIWGLRGFQPRVRITRKP